MKKILASLGIVLLALGAIYWKGKQLSVVAERETRWIREEMWEGDYFNPSSLSLSEGQAVFVRNAGLDFAEKFGMEYLKDNICDEETESCTENRLALSNVLINEGNLARAREFENLAAKYYVESGACPVMLETTLVRHIIAVVKKMDRGSSRQRASSAMQRIKSAGGIHSDLRTETCNEMLEDHPVLFHNYVMVIAELMDYVGGDEARYSAYLRKVNNIKM